MEAQCARGGCAAGPSAFYSHSMKRIAERQIQREDGEDPHSVEYGEQEEVTEVRMSLTARSGAPESPNSRSPEAPPRWPSCISTICSGNGQRIAILKCISESYFTFFRRKLSDGKCTCSQDTVTIRKREPGRGEHRCTPE